MNLPGALGRLNRAEQTFVLVDVLLVGLLVVLLLALPRGGRSAQGASPAPSSAAPVATSDAGDGEPAGERVAFTSPSGNIVCEMGVDGVVCTIGSFTYAAPPVSGCSAATGHVLRLDDDGAAFVCEDEGIPRIEGATELAYGGRQTVGGYTCASGTDGVTCTDASGAGFRLARAQWAELP